MKLTLTFALVALTSAAHQQADSGSTADAVAVQEAPQDQDAGGEAQQGGGESQQDTGYEAQDAGGEAQQAGGESQQDTGYEAQDAGGEAQQGGYEAAPMYQEHTFAPRVEICLGSCPKSSHCQHKATGACFAPVQYSAPQYSSEVSYGAAQGSKQASTQGYGRKLAGNYAAQDGNDGNYAAQDGNDGNYAAESYESTPPSSRSCPEGSINLNCARLGRKTVLWVGFFLLAIPALYFWYVAFHDSNYTDPNAWTGVSTAFGTSTVEEHISQIKKSRSVSFVICFIASLAYLTMALGYGFTTRCCDGRQFYYARYIDWAITTPLMLWKILERTKAEDHETWFIISMDILMIVAGLIGALVCGGNDKWVFFGFAMLCFLPIMYQIFQFRDHLKDDNFKNVYDQVAWITILAWMGYPIIWILAEGTGTICAQAEAICYTVLDVISKSLFGFILVQGRSNYFGGSIVAAGSIL